MRQLSKLAGTVRHGEVWNHEVIPGLSRSRTTSEGNRGTGSPVFQILLKRL